MYMKLTGNPSSASFEFMSGGGEAGEIIRSIDWSHTPLGPAAQWPLSLKTCVRIVLTSRQPMFVWWGEELINIYNDAYRAILGGKHPWAFGQPAREVWKEIWHEVGPRVESVRVNNEGTYDEALLLIMERNGYPEETYYTFSYSPVPGDHGGTHGIICANTDDTQRIVSERQLRTLKDLGSYDIDTAELKDILKNSIEVIRSNHYDFPFAYLYEVNTDLKSASLVISDTSNPVPPQFPKQLSLQEHSDLWKIAEAFTTQETQIVEIDPSNFKGLSLGFWDRPASKAMVLPVASRSQRKPDAILVIGLNPYRPLDDKYQSFVDLVTDQIANSISNAKAYEEEKRRMQALMEIDHAKTIFFSNISHEFRTPLTLMLSPLGNVLERKAQLEPDVRNNLEVAHRNALRLLKLVNSLLDFSRLEAGKTKARFVATDISRFTRDIASNFNTAIEKAGISFKIETEKIETEVFVDRDMWEKIVLNLISNAFKYTIAGMITVHLEYSDGQIIFSVKDTGVGIPAGELEKIFERFHRIENSRGRSQEGTGIGLSLVKELVHLHGGTIAVSSVEGVGSEFSVRIPTGKEHLSANQITNIADTDADSKLASSSFVEEASRWIDTTADTSYVQQEESSYAVSGDRTNAQKRYRLLLADDNADMRDYIHRLLSPRYDIVAVSNGDEAYRLAIETPPDLIISDVMMPGIDGFTLVRKLKAHPSTLNTPVILLSARAGEEATIEGLQTGADDYLVKPFSSRELTSRVDSNIKIYESRLHAVRQLHNLFMQAPVSICLFRRPNHVVELANEFYLRIIDKKREDIIGKPILDSLPEMKVQGYETVMNGVLQSGEPFFGREVGMMLSRKNRTEEAFFNFVFQPLRNLEGEIDGLMLVGHEITDIVRARQKVELNEKRYRDLIHGLPAAVYTCDVNGFITLYNDAAASIWGREPVIGKDKWSDMVKFLETDGVTSLPLDEIPIALALRNGIPVRGREMIFERHDGSRIFVQTYPQPLHDEKGSVVGAVNMLIDVTSRKLNEQHLAQLASIVESSEDAIVGKDLQGVITSWNYGAERLFGYTAEEMIGQSIAKVIPPERINEEPKILERIRRGESIEHFETVRVKKSGELVNISLTISPLRDSKGKIIGASKIARDITVQKKLDFALRDSERRYKQIAKELEERVLERTRELTEANQYLERSNSELEQFAFVTSHDLQEPLRKIQTFANLLSGRNKDSIDETGMMYIDKIVGASKRMSKLIYDLLNFSRLTKFEERFEKTDLTSILSEIKNDFEIVIQQKNAEITIHPLPTIEAIPLQMNQLFHNLISNALKFSRNDRSPLIEISAQKVDRANSEIYERLDGKRDYYEIIVKDNGIGFAPEYSEKIFEIFQRLNDKSMFEGTGIGLALCLKIVVNHHGIIFSESKEDEGATFHVILPEQNG